MNSGEFEVIYILAQTRFKKKKHVNFGVKLLKL